MRVFGLAVLVPTCAVSYLICTGDTAIALAASFLFYLSAVLLYMYPSICVALLHPNPPRALLKINLLAGWTVFGWFKAYRWALAELREQDANVLKRRD
ncbi:superinfection immunity protein [Pseudomonas palleroniana]